MSNLPSALDFTDLPSDRGSSPSERLLHRLAERAAMHSVAPRACSMERKIRRIRERTAEGRPVSLDYDTQPGAFIERFCSNEDRVILQQLTSSEAATLRLPPLFLDGGW